MERIFKFLNTFNRRYYGQMSRGAFKMIGLGVSIIFLAGVFNIGSDLDTKGVIYNLILSHLMIIVGGLILNAIKPNIFKYKDPVDLIIGFVLPLFVICFFASAFYKTPEKDVEIPK